MVKDADNMRGLCVGGDMAILPWNEPNNKITISPPTQPTHFDFWYRNRYCQHLLPYRK